MTDMNKQVAGEPQLASERPVKSTRRWAPALFAVMGSLGGLAFLVGVLLFAFNSEKAAAFISIVVMLLGLLSLVASVGLSNLIAGIRKD